MRSEAGGFANPTSHGAAASTGPVPAAPVAGQGLGLSAEQMQALQAARRDGRRITRAAGVAAFSGWTMATFAFITLLSGIFSLPALLLGIGMTGSAWVELKGSKQLRRLDTGAPVRLGFNQIALAVMLALYGGWGIFAALTGPGPYDAQIAAGGEMADMFRPIAALHMLVTVVVYGGVIIGAFIATTCTALYYFTRRRHIEAHLRRTPEWVVETLRAVG
jgi:hypothetical protein